MMQLDNGPTPLRRDWPEAPARVGPRRLRRDWPEAPARVGLTILQRGSEMLSVFSVLCSRENGIPL